MNHLKKIVPSGMIAFLGLASFLPATFAQTVSREELLRRVEEARQNAVQRAEDARLLRTRALNEIRDRRVGEGAIEQRRDIEMRSETVRRTELNRMDYENQLVRFRQARENFRGNRENLQAREHILVEVIGAFIRNAELQKQRVARFAVIDKDLQAALIAELDANIAKLKEFQAKAGAATTREELTAIALELRQYQTSTSYGKIRKLMLLAAVGVYEHRALAAASARADGIAAALQNLPQGKDIAELQTQLAGAQAQIKSATDKLDQLKSKILNQDINDTLLSEVRVELQAIQTQIRGVYTTFHDIAQAMAKFSL